jgi:hypothetical protein
VWVLVWIQFVAGMPLTHFQLNSFEGQKVCEHYKEMAKVMVTDNNMTVACLNVRIKQ